MKRQTYPWQHAVETSLRMNAYDSLSEAEKQGMLDFVASRCGNDAETARRLLDETVQHTHPTSRGQQRHLLGLLILLLVPVLLCAWVIADFSGDTRLSMMELLWTVLRTVLLIAGLALLNPTGAKLRRMQSFWEKHEPSQEGTFNALKRMYFTSVGAGLDVNGVLRNLLGVLALAGVVALMVIPAPQPSLAEQTRMVITSVTKGEATLDDAVALLQTAEDGDVVEMMRELCSTTPKGSDDRFLAVAASLRHIDESGMFAMSYPIGVIAPWQEDVLLNTDVRQIDLDAEIAALPVVLGGAWTEGVQALWTRFLAQATVDERVLAAFGTLLQDADMAEKLARCTELEAAGHDALAYLKATLADVTLAEAEIIVPTLADNAQRSLYLRACAPGITDPDEVLALIRLAGTYGVTPAQLYPEGAVLTWDTAAIDPYHDGWGEGVDADATFLVVRRVEQPEPLENLDNTDAFDGVDIYDADGHLAAGTQTVLLDTAALARIPEGRIPDTLADCDVLVLVDMQYQVDGFIRSYRITGRGSVSKYVPTYAACHYVVVYRMEDRTMLFSFDDLNALSPSTKKSEINDGSGGNLGDTPLEELYLGEVSQAWMDSAVDRFLRELEGYGWNFTTMSLKHLLR